MRRRSAEEIRELGLAGAEACFRELGIAGTSVDDIVTASGVARSTLYRHLGDRDDLLLAVTVREIEQLHAVLTTRIAQSSSVVDVLVEGVLGAVELVQESAVLRELLENPALLASEVTDQGLEALVGQLLSFVEPLAEGHHGSIRPDLDVGLAVECLVRTIASLVTLRVRPGRDQDDLRRYVRQSVVPVFVPDEARRSEGQRTTSS